MFLKPTHSIRLFGLVHLFRVVLWVLHVMTTLAEEVRHSSEILNRQADTAFGPLSQPESAKHRHPNRGSGYFCWLGLASPTAAVICTS